MRHLWVFFLVVFLSGCGSKNEKTETSIPEDGPIRLHPENPHYFLYRNKPLALITSAEHYGALINGQFDYRKYLKTLAADGMNYTRIFAGTYYELNGESFGIEFNTLAPSTEHFISPWERIAEGDARDEKVRDAGIGNDKAKNGEASTPANLKYDLNRWNPEYFDRLKDFMIIAEEHGIIVEFTFFSSIYRDMHWDFNPQNPKNHVALVDTLPADTLSRLKAHTLDNGELLSHQLKLVDKIVQEINDFDNFFFEIQNEPWADRPVPVYNIMNKEELKPDDWTFKSDFADVAAMEWQAKIADQIRQAEENLPKQHLIAQNYTNFRAPIPDVDEAISIINFHYAWPDAIRWNYHYDKVIGFDESGFAGSEDAVYRRQAWQFMLSGGGLFNHLDYSFYVGKEDGTGTYKAPGGGGPALRRQLCTLSEFLHGFELEKMHPDTENVVRAQGTIPYVLSDGEGTFAAYLRPIGTQYADLQLRVPPGEYTVKALDPVSGKNLSAENLVAEDKVLAIDLVAPDGEIALKIHPVN